MAVINTVFGFKDEVSSGLGKMNSNLEITKGKFDSLSMTLTGISSAIAIFDRLKDSVGSLNAKMEELTAGYMNQSEQELKLETIMRQRMNATEEDIQYVKDLASEQQKLGIYGDELILQGAQELASFTSNKEAIAELVPAMNNLIAQQYGYSASGQTFQSTADMMGKVLSGQTGALSRLGYIFSEEEKQMLQFGTEEQRASTLAKIITDNVGNMNQALASTSVGGIQQLNNAFGDLKEESGRLLIPITSAIQGFKITLQTDFYQNLNKFLEIAGEKIADFITSLQNIYVAVRPYLERVGTLFVSVFSTIGAKIGAIKDYIVAHIHSIMTAMTVLAGVFVGKLSLMLAQTVITTGIMIAKWAMTNWAMLAGIAIIAIIIKKIIDTGTTFQQVGSYIGAVLGGVFANFYNIGVAVANLFLSIAEFIINLDDPVKAFARLFWDLIGNILTWIAPLVDTVDYIVGALTKKGAQGWGDYVRNAKSELQSWVDSDLGTNNRQLVRFEQKSTAEISTTIQQGASLGEYIGNRIDVGIDGICGLLKDMGPEQMAEQMGDEVGSLFNMTGNGALLVSNNDKVNVAEDEYEILGRLADERARQNIHSVTPTIHIDTFNVSDEGMSPEEAVEELFSKFAELSDSNLSRTMGAIY